MQLLLTQDEQEIISSLLNHEIIETKILIRHTRNPECKDNLKYRRETLKDLKRKVDCNLYQENLN